MSIYGNYVHLRHKFLFRSDIILHARPHHLRVGVGVNSALQCPRGPTTPRGWMGNKRVNGLQHRPYIVIKSVTLGMDGISRVRRLVLRQSSSNPTRAAWPVSLTRISLGHPRRPPSWGRGRQAHTQGVRDERGVRGERGEGREGGEGGEGG